MNYESLTHRVARKGVFNHESALSKQTEPTNTHIHADLHTLVRTLSKRTLTVCVSTKLEKQCV